MVARCLFFLVRVLNLSIVSNPFVVDHKDDLTCTSRLFRVGGQWGISDLAAYYSGELPLLEGNIDATIPSALHAERPVLPSGCFSVCCLLIFTNIKTCVSKRWQSEHNGKNCYSHGQYRLSRISNERESVSHWHLPLGKVHLPVCFSLTFGRIETWSPQFSEKLTAMI